MAFAELCIDEQGVQRRGVVGGIMAVDENARDTVRDRGGQSADASSDDWRAAGLGLDRHESERLVVGRYADDAGGGVPVSELGLAHRRDEPDDVVEAERRAQVGERGGVLEAAAGGAADDGDDEPIAQARIAFQHHRGSIEDDVGCLERLDPPGEQQQRGVGRDVEQLAGDVLAAGLEHLEVDAGMHHGDSVGIGVIELDQLASFLRRIGDQLVGETDDLLLAVDAADRLGRITFGELGVLDLRHRVHRVHEGYAPSLAGDGADLP